MKALIVDDIETNRKLLRVNLEAEGFETCEAIDGIEALKATPFGSFPGRKRRDSATGPEDDRWWRKILEYAFCEISPDPE